MSGAGTGACDHGRHQGWRRGWRSTSATLRLQIVPTLYAMLGLAGGESTLSLYGSGFMEGASTVTIGGTALSDNAVIVWPWTSAAAATTRLP